MHWRRVDPVQQVDGLLVGGIDPRTVLDDVAKRVGKFAALDAVLGDDWLVLIPKESSASREARRALVLPRIEGAAPLYERLQGIWLPVGWEAAAPAHVEPGLLRAAMARCEIDAPIVIAPCGNAEFAERADVYELKHRISLDAASKSAARA